MDERLKVTPDSCISEIWLRVLMTKDTTAEAIRNAKEMLLHDWKRMLPVIIPLLPYAVSQLETLAIEDVTFEQPSDPAIASNHLAVNDELPPPSLPGWKNKDHSTKVLPDSSKADSKVASNGSRVPMQQGTGQSELQKIMEEVCRNQQTLIFDGETRDLDVVYLDNNGKPHAVAQTQVLEGTNPQIIDMHPCSSVAVEPDQQGTPNGLTQPQSSPDSSNVSVPASVPENTLPKVPSQTAPVIQEPGIPTPIIATPMPSESTQSIPLSASDTKQGKPTWIYVCGGSGLLAAIGFVFNKMKKSGGKGNGGDGLEVDTFDDGPETPFRQHSDPFTKGFYPSSAYTGPAQQQAQSPSYPPVNTRGDLDLRETLVIPTSEDITA